MLLLSRWKLWHNFKWLKKLNWLELYNLDHSLTELWHSPRYFTFRNRLQKCYLNLRHPTSRCWARWYYLYLFVSVLTCPYVQGMDAWYIDIVDEAGLTRPYGSCGVGGYFNDTDGVCTCTEMGGKYILAKRTFSYFWFEMITSFFLSYKWYTIIFMIKYLTCIEKKCFIAFIF